jgi:hypothetical protein
MELGRLDGLIGVSISSWSSIESSSDAIFEFRSYILKSTFSVFLLLLSAVLNVLSIAVDYETILVLISFYEQKSTSI